MTELLDNNWLSLTVVDPQQEHRAFHYEGELNWAPLDDRMGETPDSAMRPTAADD